ncbi:MAG: LTA synthase family protein [Deltaproteobacteria bacterium]|nr:LTA synthase family protein [Deltaproteobacteria bacterium]
MSSFRIRLIALLALLYLLVNFTLRAVLFVAFSSELPLSADTFSGFATGMLNDCAALVFTIIVPTFLILLIPEKFMSRLSGRCLSLVTVFLFSTASVFTALSEYYFWEEFGCRFNFIAVDYLIYTKELMDNAMESYPLGRLMTGVVIVSSLLTALVWLCLKKTNDNATENSDRHSSSPAFGPGGRLIAFASFCVLASLVYFLFTPLSVSPDRNKNEFAKNGIYELFSAYLGNQLDYRAFYRTMDTREAFSLLEREKADIGAGDRHASGYWQDGRNGNAFRPGGEYGVVAEPGGEYGIVAEPGAQQGFALSRSSSAKGHERRPNVIIVIMESMGSSWLGELTPELNGLAERGLTFTRMLSTGTRTVRGIEAVMLSVPPTPGSSIVRRPDNGGLFTLGTPFRRRGYSLDFVYGGIGYFDNMNAFFESNGYRVTDKLGFSGASRTFSNAWGQCDGDLYSESVRLADLSYREGVPFHQVLLTTSNHRPFTFPEGKIDLPQGTREAAVRYADHAAGEFVRYARAKPWFHDTVILFIGDHPSSIAGKTYLPPDGYGIVSLFYGPEFFASERIGTLASQLDVGPTLLSALGWDTRSRFFGTDARNLPPATGRAWISTYQLLGFRTEDRLAVLKPDRNYEVTRLSPGAPDTRQEADDEEAHEARGGDVGEEAHEARGDNVREDVYEEGAESAELLKDEIIVVRAVASYQCAYDLFTLNGLKESAVEDYAPPVPSVSPNPDPEAGWFRLAEIGRKSHKTASAGSDPDAKGLPHLDS